ncbi:superoxide dismutase family protein [Ramlibacter sp.]|uniref:superoxide dismutase family protein n=1 Tax=Ramlibacter sp. TaxID=1917967 RepID=UPI002CF37DED|nr:superoxide dismutase family protein [Ramlibacter sp.]HWI83297.1 superoxide dismutase family protein [Ramlibacter sp.]
MRIHPTLTFTAAGFLAVALAGCAAMGGGATATAALRPTTGNQASGTVRFVQRGSQVHVAGEVRGLKPNAEHGFHVHEKGDCYSGDGMSTGGHFNPDGKAHGRHDASAHHAGDLPSLKADADGVARFSFDTGSISVGPGAANVVGRGLIVHRDPDDYTTQPTGNAGPRLACAVIAKG